MFAVQSESADCGANNAPQLCEWSLATSGVARSKSDSSAIIRSPVSGYGHSRCRASHKQLRWFFRLHIAFVASSSRLAMSLCRHWCCVLAILRGSLLSVRVCGQTGTPSRRAQRPTMPIDDLCRKSITSQHRTLGQDSPASTCAHPARSDFITLVGVLHTALASYNRRWLMNGRTRLNAFHTPPWLCEIEQRTAKDDRWPRPWPSFGGPRQRVNNDASDWKTGHSLPRHGGAM